MGLKEVIKFLEGRRLPLLPKQKENILTFLIFLVIFISAIILIQKFSAPKITNAEYAGKKLKVFSNKKLLFEK